MALKKARDIQKSKPKEERRSLKRNFQGLINQLNDPDIQIRRWAARELAGFEQAVEPLCRRLQKEQVLSVQEAILNSLLTIGGEEVVKNLIPFLRSDDAGLRNKVIEVLQALPEAVAPYIEKLLRDPDSDVRIFAVDILQVLPHAQVPEWLLQVIMTDNHVNVVAAALDRLAEVGTPEMIPALLEVKKRFANEPYIAFAVDTVIERTKSEA